MATGTATLSARYPAADGWHDVVVSRDPGGRWQVFDLAGPDALLVETLTGYDDRLAQAQALARDYAVEQQAYRAGLREDPLPRPALARATHDGDARPR